MEEIQVDQSTRAVIWMKTTRTKLLDCVLIGVSAAIRLNREHVYLSTNIVSVITDRPLQIVSIHI